MTLHKTNTLSKTRTLTPKQDRRIACISDIHSNILALDAVLADIKKRGINTVVNLGDILYGPIAPRATFERLMMLEDEFETVITIRGNQDRQIYEAYFDDKQTELSQNPTMQFIIEDLPKAAIDWLQSLPFDCLLMSAQATNDVYICHGSPTDDMVYLLEDVGSGTPVVRQDTQIVKRLANNRTPVIVCGHTHIARTVTLSTGQIIVNTGSVGYPAYQDDLPVLHNMQTYSPHASYVVIDNQANVPQPSWLVNHIKVPYDHQAAASIALKNGRADWEYALLTGRVQPNEHKE